MSQPEEFVSGFFKVVSRWPGHSLNGWSEHPAILSSAAVMQEAFATHYKLNEWVYPKREHTQLFVFDSQPAARDFLEHMIQWQGNRFEMYACDVLDPSPCLWRVPILKKCLEMFWSVPMSTLQVAMPDEALRQSLVDEIISDLISAPKGSHLCRAVRLTGEPLAWK